MKSKNQIIIAVILIAILFFWIGYIYGTSKKQKEFDNKPIDEILLHLNSKEAQKIDSLLTQNLDIVKESSLDYFNRENYDVCKGYIKNNAFVTLVKDITLKLDYYTKTKSLLKSDTLTIFEYILPKDSLAVNEKINKPKLTSTVEITILSVKTD